MAAFVLTTPAVINAIVLLLAFMDKIVKSVIIFIASNLYNLLNGNKREKLTN